MVTIKIIVINIKCNKYLVRHLPPPPQIKIVLCNIEINDFVLGGGGVSLSII
jgi:hypothetical protein